jgi:hypothetical protein
LFTGLSRQKKLMAKRKISPALFILLLACLAGCKSPSPHPKITVIGRGHLPDIASGEDGKQHIVFGSSDSIFYALSKDEGSTFTPPALVAVLPGLAAAAMRGPQIAVTQSGIVVLAGTHAGNLYAFTKSGDQPWSPAVNVTDKDSVNLEQFTDLAAEGNHVFAVWLDLRDDHRNKIYGALSKDGGQHWSANRLVYKSPDSTVCQCCKPGTVMKDGKVYVMFRNWLDGNRDFYLAESGDNGETFHPPVKLGSGSWALNGCPMDGGAITIDGNDQPQTIWRRKDLLFTATTGIPEIPVASGRNPAITSIDNHNVFAWVKDDSIQLRKSNGNTVLLGKGTLPRLAAAGHKIWCSWEDEGQILSALVDPD